MMRDRNQHFARMALHLNRLCRTGQIKAQKLATLSVLSATTRQATKVLNCLLKLRLPQLKSLLLACQKQTNGALRAC